MCTRKLLWLAFIFLVVIPGVPFVLLSIVMMAYIYWPVGYDEMVFPIPDAGAKHITVLAHGLRDNPASWSDSLKQVFESRGDDGKVFSLDWTQYSTNAFRCSVNGRRIGVRLGRSYAQDPTLVTVHAIGHSCGSFIALGICEGLRDSRGDVAIQTTFLDPVTVYGGLFWDYGLKHFGSCADFSDAYIDTEDDVPGSNQLLPNTHTFDVTEVHKQTDYQGKPHDWPTVYYQRLATQGTTPELRRDSTIGMQFPAGVLEKVRD